MGIQDTAIMFVPTAVAFGKLQFLSDILHDTPVFGIFEVSFFFSNHIYFRNLM